ncbi:type II toxin-antitoxin system RelE/ParE family toxin [Rhizobium sp. G21]|nr:type II toxin-antitoxin system RelE/ParE family toxin [Rhizobium sp. G21]
MAAARLSRTRRALQKLTHIDSAIGRSNPVVATAVTARIRDCAAMLALNPRMGRPGRIAGAREIHCSALSLHSRLAPNRKQRADPHGSARCAKMA